MVIVRLNGGLGNQMFQYAAGLRLATEWQVPLKLDLRFYETNQSGCEYRNYGLDCFNINADIATPSEIGAFKTASQKRPLFAFFRHPFIKSTPGKGFTFLREEYFHFNPAVLTAKPPVYLDGYWQSEKYFKDCESGVRKAFLYNKPLDNRYADIGKKISSSNSVSVHIRRGDYMSSKRVADVHGLCPLEYYNKAIEKIAGLINQPEFFIFSDDIKWAKNNLTSSFFLHFIKGDKTKPCDDLNLMSQCKNHIIANSSFSWWGAWLSKYKNKIVIAPFKWFLDPRKNTSDLIPNTWIRL